MKILCLKKEINKLMFTSWIRKIILLFLLQTPLYCYSIKVIMPDYSKYESVGINLYEIFVSENGVIQNIYCKKSDGSEKKWNIDTQKSISVEKETSSYQVIIKAFSSMFFIVKDGMVYTAYQDIDNIQAKYEFYNKTKEEVEVLCSLNHGDVDRNVYDTYMEKIKISGRRFFSIKEEDQIHNLRMVMRTGLAEVLIPYIVCDERVFLKTEFKYSAASELIEKNIIYSASNLGRLDGNPWATNQLEKAELFIEIPVKSKTEIAFYNGFQHSTKTNLYKDNSRAKEIFIVNTANKKSITICLKDSPEKQVVDLSEIIRNEGEVVRLKLKIQSVYEGAKYRDLCIQAIMAE